MSLQFGIALSTSAARDADPLADARLAERLGFDFLTVSDHPTGDHPTYETWTLLSWVAGQTERIGLATNVLAIPNRAPFMLAKMAESLDRLAGGRLILGIGAGGNDEAAGAMGLRVRTPPEKLQATREQIEILRGLWKAGEMSYEGRQFALHGARLTPRPERRIPIWVGSYGPKAVALTGRLADGWTPSLPYLPLPRAVELRRSLLAAAAEAGRDPGAITCNYNFTIRLGARNHDERMVGGSVDEIVARFHEFIAAGFTSFGFWPLGGRDEVQRLGEDLLPRLRELG